MSTLHRVRRFALAALAAAQVATLAPASAGATQVEAVAALGAMTVLAARETGVANLGRMTVSAARPEVTELGSLVVTARRDAALVVAQARSGVASEAPRVHSWN